MKLKPLALTSVLLTIMLFQQSAVGRLLGIDLNDKRAMGSIHFESNEKNQYTQDQPLLDDKIKNNIIQESLIKEKAAFWGLTIEEWHTFEALTEKGGRGYWSPNLDPLTTLGVEAKTQAEREHYARLLAKKEFERTEKELEFQRVYNQEFKKLYPDILPIELDDNPNFVAPLNQDGERMTLFLDVDDVVRGIGLLEKALKANKEMDIYLLGTSGEDERIQVWAKTYALPVNLVKSGFITLNHNQGQWQRIGKGVLPILLQEQNGGKFRQIELGD